MKHEKIKDGILENLNAAQKEAVLYFDSPLLVIAGAGSGKTKVITNKIAYLIEKKGYSPANILGVTFTNKAAGEMKNRVASLTHIDARLFNISTFHSLGLKILRESGSASGFDSHWQIIDDRDQKKIIERIIKENLSYFTSDMRETVTRKIRFAKMDSIYPNNKEYLYQKGFNEDEVKIFSLYFDYQKENKVWDFEDLVSLPVKLLQANEDTRTKYAERYKYVLVDEFQDTNPNQYELLTLIAGNHQNISVVGDDDQAVYSWRGASIRFLFNFENDFPGAHMVKLEQNYRSTPQILEFANSLITRNSLRRPKSMWTEEKNGNPVFILNTTSKEDEAARIADLICRLKENEADVFPIAVLYRINSQSLAFETEFARRNIDFKILKGLRFFDRKEIKDSLALLKLAANLNDDISFLRVVDFLPLGIGAKTLASLSETAKGKNLSLFQALKEAAPDKFKAGKIFLKIDGMHREMENTAGNLSGVLTLLLQTSGYRDILEKKGEQDRLLNIDELIAFIGNWEKSNPAEKFAHLLDRISLDAGSVDNKEPASEAAPVFLLTMHNAKGLEFPSVIAAGINSSYMPFFMAQGKAEVEEERRLFYVAATRAIKQLVVSTGAEKPSRFLSGVSRALYAKAYSVEDILEYLAPGLVPTDPAPGTGNEKSRLEELLGQVGASRSVEEKFIDHPIFGRGKIIDAIDDEKFIVEFAGRGQKTIDASVVPLTFL